jgi:two-component system sensor histidine kinase/response regulator
MNILLIEDEFAIRETLREILEINGHSVSTAADGPEGIALAAQRPDLILCDVGLPSMDGFEVIRAVQQLPQCHDVPFIFLTAHASREDQRRGMALGADDYITKPFTQHDIIDAINARIRRQQPLRERVEKVLAARRTEIGADWSHELMTPLNGVLGGLELIEAEADTIKPGELKQLLSLIRAGAERQHVLSRKLVLYFELERCKVAPPAQPFSCAAADAITTGVANANALHRERFADVTASCEPARLSLADTHLAGAVTELVDNALRFSQPGQPVGITAARHGSRYVIEIADAGASMSEEQRTRFGIFEQFGRDAREHQGLGLGLAIARSAAEIAGGQLTLHPGPQGRGLRVRIELPCTV